MSSKKTLIIFDFDNTLLNKDSDEAIYSLIPEDIAKEKYAENLKTTNNWIDFMNSVFHAMTQNNMTIADITASLDKLTITEGFDTLLENLKNNVNNEIVIFSGANEFCLHYLLNKANLMRYFTTIMCHRTEMRGNMLYEFNDFRHDCENCEKSMCKGEMLKTFLNDKDINEYEKIIFICDGLNDLCLAKGLKESDCVYIRKDYSLDKKLREGDMKDIIKCKTVFWVTGNDIESD